MRVKIWAKSQKQSIFDIFLCRIWIKCVSLHLRLPSSSSSVSHATRVSLRCRAGTMTHKTEETAARRRGIEAPSRIDTQSPPLVLSRLRLSLSPTSQEGGGQGEKGNRNRKRRHLVPASCFFSSSELGSAHRFVSGNDGEDARDNWGICTEGKEKKRRKRLITDWLRRLRALMSIVIWSSDFE